MFIAIFASVAGTKPVRLFVLFVLLALVLFKTYIVVQGVLIVALLFDCVFRRLKEYALKRLLPSVKAPKVSVGVQATPAQDPISD